MVQPMGTIEGVKWNSHGELLKELRGTAYENY